MPSYRYTKDIKPEDLAPSTEPPLQGKAKAKNWWHYHWKIMAVGALTLGIAVFLLLDVFLKVKPDITIGLLTPYALPDAAVEKLQDALGPLVGDVNGDGKVVVQIETYTVGNAAGEGEAYNQMAGTVKLAAVLSSGNPMVFLVDGANAEDYQNQYGIFGLENGEIPAEGIPLDSFTVQLADWPGFASADLSLLGDDGQPVDAHEALGNFRLGVRPILGTSFEGKADAETLWQQGWALLHALSGAA